LQKAGQKMLSAESSQHYGGAKGGSKGLFLLLKKQFSPYLFCLKN
jgi:hypothetical protein